MLIWQTRGSIEWVVFNFRICALFLIQIKCEPVTELSRVVLSSLRSKKRRLDERDCKLNWNSHHGYGFTAENAAENKKKHSFRNLSKGIRDVSCLLSFSLYYDRRKLVIAKLIQLLLKSGINSHTKKDTFKKSNHLIEHVAIDDANLCMYSQILFPAPSQQWLLMFFHRVSAVEIT